MAQFAVYRNEDEASHKTYPYFLGVQNNLLNDLNSRLVIPLSPFSLVEQNNVKRLCPIVSIEKNKYVLLAHQLTTIPSAKLKHKIISLENFRDEIMSALDFLIAGI